MRLEMYPHPRSNFWKGFLEGIVDDDEDDARLRALSPVLTAWLAAAKFPVGTTLAMLPYSLEFR